MPGTFSTWLPPYAARAEVLDDSYVRLLTWVLEQILHLCCLRERRFFANRNKRIQGVVVAIDPVDVCLRQFDARDVTTTQRTGKFCDCFFYHELTWPEFNGFQWANLALWALFNDFGDQIEAFLNLRRK